MPRDPSIGSISIPVGWRQARLSQILQQKPDYGANAVAVPYDPVTCYRYIRITDIDDHGNLRPDTVKGIGREVGAGSLLHDGELVIARTGASVGKSYLYKATDGECAFAGYLIRFRPDQAQVSARYLAQYLRSPLYWRWVCRTAQVGTQPNISAEEYGNLEVILPTVAEQERIVTLLLVWDEVISEAVRCITTRRRLRQGLVQRMLNGRSRFAEFAQSQWRKQRLGDLFTEFREYNGDLAVWRVLSCTKIGGIMSQEERFDKRIASSDLSRYKVVRDGDLVFDPMLLWDGSIGFVRNRARGVVSPAYTTLELDESRGDRVFLEALFQTHLMKHWFRVVSQGTNVRRRKAPSSAFLNIEVEMPPTLAEQRKIAHLLQLVDGEIELLEKQLAAYKLQKKGLMQKLLTGEIRVTV